jgi:hypothetical protein
MFSFRHSRCRVLIALVATTIACKDHVDPVFLNPTVVFTLDAPLCSSILPVQLLIDHVQVAVDTFTPNLGTRHITTRPFPTTQGQHVLGARVINGYVWSDTTVTLQNEQTFTRTLPFYCS